MILLLSLEEYNRHKKGFNQHEKSAAPRSAVNRFAGVPSSTDDIVETVTNNLLDIQQKILSTLIKALSSIRCLACERLPWPSHNDSESNFQKLRAEHNPNF